MSFLGALGGNGGNVGNSLIRIGVNATGVRGQVRGVVSDIKSELRSGTAAIEREGSRWNSVFKVGALAIGGIAVAAAGAVGWATKIAIDYETAFAGVRKTVSATEPQLAALSDQFRAMSRDIPVSAVELAKLGEAAGALGIPIESIKEFARVTALIGVTTNVASDQAATALGQLSNVMKLSQSDYSRFASTLVDLGNKGASTEAQILDMTSRVGAAGKLIGLSTPDVLGFSSAVASLGIEVEAGGTSLQQFFLLTNKAVLATGKSTTTTKGATATARQLAEAQRRVSIAAQSASDAQRRHGASSLAAQRAQLSLMKAEDALRKLRAGPVTTTNKATNEGLATLAKTAGMTEAAFKSLYQKSPTKALESFITGLGKLDSAGQQAVLAVLKMGDTRLTRTLLGLANNSALLTTNIDNASAAWKANTALQGEATKRFQTTSSQLAILKNRLTDIGITAGSAVLPGLVKVISWLSDKLPAALKIVGRVWDTTLAPALGAMLGGFGHLGTAIAAIFGGDNKTQSNAARFEAVLTTVATAAGAVARALGSAADVLGSILSVGPMRELARVGIILGAIALALGASRAAVAGLRGITGGLLSSLTGGAIGGQSHAPLDGSARKLDGSAAKLDRAAARLERSAGGGLGGAAGAGPRWAGAPEPGSKAALTWQPAGGFGTAQEQADYIHSAAVARAMASAERDAVLAGRTIVGRTAGRLGDAIKGGAGRAADGARNLVGAAGAVFWPVMIGGLAMSLAQGPLGDLVAGNPKFVRAGARIKQDFIGGLVDLAVSWGQGSDLALALKRANLGSVGIDTKALRNTNLTDAQVAALSQGGVAGASAQRDVSPTLLAGLQNSTKESVLGWYHRVIDQLTSNGIDQSALIAAFQRVSAEYNAPGSAMTHDQYLDRLDAVAKPILSGMVQQLLTKTMTSTTQGVNTAVVAALATVSGGRIKFADTIGLPQATYDKLATLLIQQATLDPTVFALTLSGFLTKNKPPKPQKPQSTTTRGTPSVGNWVNTATPAQAAASATRVADADALAAIKAKAARLEELIAGLDTTRTALLEAFKTTPDATTGRPHTDAEIADYTKTLHAAQAADRQTNLDALASIDKAVAGLTKLSGSKAHQKQQKADRAKLLAQVNSARALIGEAPLDWTGLINWRATLSESTGATARKEVAAELKKWSVGAAKDGAVGGAAAFATAWGPAIEGAAGLKGTKGTAARAALLKSINANLPKKEQFKSWTALRTFLDDQVKAGAVSAALAVPGALGLVGKAFDDWVPPPLGPPTLAVPVITEQVDKEWRDAGGNAAGALLAGAAAALGAGIGGILSIFSDHLPSGSPAKRGAWAGPAWRAAYRAGGNVAGQMLDGYAARLRTGTLGAGMPALPTARLAPAGAVPGGQTIHFDNANILSPADDASLLRRVRFMGRA